MPTTPDADQDTAGYGDWALAPVPLPPRSRLYHLAPLGVGTAGVESLTGYLMRLAAAHCVSPFVLARREIAPVFGTARRVEIETQLGALMGCGAQRLNGLDPEADRWAGALAALTGRADLHALTLRPWAGAVASRGLLRRGLAWCPACYAAWRREGRAVYQPLRWALQAVAVCARHRRPLLERCPHPGCGRPQPAIAPALRPGHCTACGHWLGEPADAPPAADPPGTGARLAWQLWAADPPGTGARLAWQLWVAEAVGMWLAVAPGTAPVPHNRVRDVVEECLAHLGGDEPLRHVAHLPWDTIRVWRRGTSIPTLGSLLRFCHHLGVPPHRFLAAGAAALAPDGPLPGTPDAPRPRRPRGSFDVAGARETLRAALVEAQEVPVSVPTLARQLGCGTWALQRHLPEECRALVARRAAYRTRAVREAHARRCDEVRRATRAVHEQGLYPNGRRVAALLSNPRDLIRAEVRAVWQATVRELGWQPRRRKGVYIA